MISSSCINPRDILSLEDTSFRSSVSVSVLEGFLYSVYRDGEDTVGSSSVTFCHFYPVFVFLGGEGADLCA